MRHPMLSLMACGLAAAVPLLPPGRSPSEPVRFPGWPAHFEGRPLQPFPLPPRAARFAEGFPGRIAGFTDGRRAILLRFVTRPTRQLHPAADCYRGAGFRVRPRPVRRDRAGDRWGCFGASRRDQHLVVCERIHDESGASWTDVSSWYWEALLERSQGPWWAITVEEAGSSPTREEEETRSGIPRRRAQDLSDCRARRACPRLWRRERAQQTRYAERDQDLVGVAGSGARCRRM